MAMPDCPSQSELYSLCLRALCLHCTIQCLWNFHASQAAANALHEHAPSDASDPACCCSTSGIRLMSTAVMCAQAHECFRQNYESLFYQFGVDIVMHGACSCSCPIPARITMLLHPADVCCTCIGSATTCQIKSCRLSVLAAFHIDAGAGY